MSRDSVRYGRVPKRSRDKIEETPVLSADLSVHDQKKNQAAMYYETILNISQAHHTNCAYTEEKTRGLIRKPAVFGMAEFSTNSEGQVTVDNPEHRKIYMWQNFAAFLTPSIQGVVEFAKRVPGFLELTQDDQLILIKLGFFEVWLVHIARMVNHIDNTLTFCDGSYISRQQMEFMFDHEFVSLIFSFIVSFNNLQLNDTDIGLFSAVVLLSSKRPGIYDHKTIEQLQEELLEALKFQINHNHPSEPHLFANLIIKLPELHELGGRHMDHLRWFRANWIHLKLPPLFAEVFDIPSPEDVGQR